MTQAKWCEGCSQAHDCKTIYERLGHIEGPSVARKVVVAFVLPIAVFVVALGTFGRLLQHALVQRYLTLCSLALAVCTTVGVMLIVSVITKRLNKT
jgi:Kef-type K+ transport system membrane component KefB